MAVIVLGAVPVAGIVQPKKPMIEVVEHKPGYGPTSRRAVLRIVNESYSPYTVRRYDSSRPNVYIAAQSGKRKRVVATNYFMEGLTIPPRSSREINVGLNSRAQFFRFGVRFERGTQMEVEARQPRKESVVRKWLRDQFGILDWHQGVVWSDPIPMR